MLFTRVFYSDFQVTLCQQQIAPLIQSRKGKVAAAKLIHARALLLCDQGDHSSEPLMVKDAAKALGVSTRTIEKVKKVILGLDNLNIHKRASLYEVFPAEGAKRLANRLELHFTPVHGSWLNICEIELSVLGKQCLNRKIEDMKTITSEVEKGRNNAITRKQPSTGNLPMKKHV